MAELYMLRFKSPKIPTNLILISRPLYPGTSELDQIFKIINILVIVYPIL